jgi:hypothetical protein
MIREPRFFPGKSADEDVKHEDVQPEASNSQDLRMSSRG